MPAVQVHAAVGRRCERRHVRGGDDCIRAGCGRFLGGVVRAVSDDLSGARGPGQESRRRRQSRQGGCRCGPRTRRQVRGAVDPVAGRDPGRARGRPNRRRASSRCVGAAVAASARRLSVLQALRSVTPTCRRPRMLVGTSDRRVGDHRPVREVQRRQGDDGTRPEPVIPIAAKHSSHVSRPRDPDVANALVRLESLDS